MKNTEKFFYGVAGFIEDMREISARYEKAVQQLEPYRGSAGYDQGIRDAQAEKENDVRQMRETYLKQFRQSIGNMRDAVHRRPLTPPTPDQAALLSVLQMRTSLSRSELERAARQLEGCPMALAVLDDLAARHKAHGAPFNQELSDELLCRRIDTLERKALELVREGAEAAKRKAPQDAVDCLDLYGAFPKAVKQDAALYGSITSDDVETDVQMIQAFCDVANGGT